VKVSEWCPSHSDLRERDFAGLLALRQGEEEPLFQYLHLAFDPYDAA
jgi:hypothetical protein